MQVVKLGLARLVMAGNYVRMQSSSLKSRSTNMLYACISLYLVILDHCIGGSGVYRPVGETDRRLEADRIALDCGEVGLRRATLQ
jgi:hypothetical protein